MIKKKLEAAIDRVRFIKRATINIKDLTPRDNTIRETKTIPVTKHRKIVLIRGRNKLVTIDLVKLKNRDKGYLHVETITPMLYKDDPKEQENYTIQNIRIYDREQRFLLVYDSQNVFSLLSLHNPGPFKRRFRKFLYSTTESFNRGKFDDMEYLKDDTFCVTNGVNYKVIDFKKRRIIMGIKTRTTHREEMPANYFEKHLDIHYFYRCCGELTPYQINLRLRGLVTHDLIDMFEASYYINLPAQNVYRRSLKEEGFFCEDLKQVDNCLIESKYSKRFGKKMNYVNFVRASTLKKRTVLLKGNIPNYRNMMKLFFGPKKSVQ